MRKRPRGDELEMRHLNPRTAKCLPRPRQFQEIIFIRGGGGKLWLASSACFLFSSRVFVGDKTLELFAQALFFIFSWIGVCEQKVNASFLGGLVLLGGPTFEIFLFGPIGLACSSTDIVTGPRSFISFLVCWAWMAAVPCSMEVGS